MLKRPLPAVSDNLQSEDNTTADVNWMKHTPAVSTDSNLVFERMKNTLLVRRNMVNAMNSAGHIIEEFPQFKITPGLVSMTQSILTGVMYAIRLWIACIYKCAGEICLSWAWTSLEGVWGVATVAL